jgi:hypothetical protein
MEWGNSRLLLTEAVGVNQYLRHVSDLLEGQESRNGCYVKCRTSRQKARSHKMLIDALQPNRRKHPTHATAPCCTRTYKNRRMAEATFRSLISIASKSFPRMTQPVPRGAFFQCRSLKLSVITIASRARATKWASVLFFGIGLLFRSLVGIDSIAAI